MDSKGVTSKKRKAKWPRMKTTGGKGKIRLKEDPSKGRWKQHWLCPTTTCHEPKYPPDVERDKRFLRYFLASRFTDCCTLVKGGKICISSSEFEAFVPPTPDCCFDSSWVAVHGIHSICAVTFRKVMDLSNLSASLRFNTTETKNMEFLSEAVISQVECIPYNDFGCKDEILRGKVVKPFAVVSLVLDTETSWDEAKGPISKFLYQRMRNSGLAFTDNETIQTAIGAFQHVCHGQELSAKDIRVASFDVSSGQFDHLDIDRITEQLDMVKNGKSATSPLQSQVSSETPV